jgi:hypothetical protein
VERNAEKLALGQATLIETDRHNVNPDETRAYLDCSKDQLKTIPLILVWNADERRVATAKKQQAANVVLSSRTGPEPITVPEIRDDSQLTLLTAISAFGGSTPPFFLSKNKNFEKDLLGELEMYEGHD